MNWLLPSLIATLSNTAILALVYLYLYLKEKERSLWLFFISWSVYSLRFVAMLLYIYIDRTSLLIVNQILVVISSHMLVVAVNTWLKKTPTPLILNVASIISLLWIFGAFFIEVPFTTYTIPVFLYVGFLYINIGIILLRSSQRSTSGVKIVSTTLIIWGLHKIDYPFLRPVEWFAPWGYLLGAFAAVITAIGMILTYFETTKKELTEVIKEKELLIREVHHRVKNNLSILHSLLNHNYVTNDDPTIREILKKLEDKVFAFSLIHSLLHKSDSIKKIDFYEYLNDFAEHLIISYGESKKILHLEVEKGAIFLDINQAKTLGLIINELFTNALKHAFKDSSDKHITVSISELSKRNYILTIHDNGIGLPENFEMDNPKISGLYLVRMLCEEINGEFRIRKVEGTEIQIKFSLDNMDS